MIRDFLKKIFNSVFSWLVRPWFWIHRWMQDKVFLVNLKNRDLPPGIHAYPIWLIFSFFRFVKNCWSIAYRDYGMQLYSKWIGIHYGPKGRGYFNYGDLTDKEKLAFYGEPRGRIEYFLKNNLRILGYRDGQSFIDAGCGRGQNIKVLTEYFPKSSIRSFDVSEGALDAVRLGVKNQKQILVETGSLTDADYLAQYPTNGYDHVFVSHVFSFIIADGEMATHKLRQRIIDDLIRIAKKTVLILDGSAILNLSKPLLEIEQLRRAHYYESIVPYFNAHLAYGEICALFSSECIGVLYRKRPD